jgi:hypothetical protein
MHSTSNTKNADAIQNTVLLTTHDSGTGCQDFNADDLLQNLTEPTLVTRLAAQDLF